MTDIAASNFLTGQMNSMIRGSLSETEKNSRKATFIEGLILFLEIYGASEIGITDIDFMKLSLYVDSPVFENVYLKKFRTIHSVFEFLTEQVLNNKPLYRFLIMNDTQKEIFEKAHIKELQEQMMKDAEELPCLKCIWYSIQSTPFGILENCAYPVSTFYHPPTRFNINKHKKCKKCVMANDECPVTTPKNYTENRIKREFNRHKNAWLNRFNNLDNSNIPVYVDDEDIVSLIKEDDEDEFISLAKELGRGFNNKRSLHELRQSLRKALMFSVMIRFFNIYAQTEIGSDYRADIKKIAKFVTQKKYKKYMNFVDEDTAFANIENAVINEEIDPMKFVRIYEL